MKNVNSKEEYLLKQMESSSLTQFIHWTIFVLSIICYIYLRSFKRILVLPEEVWFPFFIDQFYKKYLVTFQQMMFITQIGLLTVADGIIFLLINNATVKLKVLADSFAKVNNNNQLKKCVQQHQQILL